MPVLCNENDGMLGIELTNLYEIHCKRMSINHQRTSRGVVYKTPIVWGAHVDDKISFHGIPRVVVWYRQVLYRQGTWWDALYNYWGNSLVSLQTCFFKIFKRLWWLAKCTVYENMSSLSLWIARKRIQGTRPYQSHLDYGECGGENNLEDNAQLF